MKNHSQTISKSNIRLSELNPKAKKNVNNVKAKFGFFFVGLKINMEEKDDVEENENFKKKYTKIFSHR